MLSPGMSHTMLGMVGIAPDGSALRFDTHVVAAAPPESPSGGGTWNWMNPGDRNDAEILMEKHVREHAAAGMMNSVGNGGYAGYMERIHGYGGGSHCDDDVAAALAAATAAAVAASGRKKRVKRDSAGNSNDFEAANASGLVQPKLETADRVGGIGGMSGAMNGGQDEENGEGGEHSSSQDGDEYANSKDRNLRRGKGAIYCIHRKLLYRFFFCNECSSLGNPSHVITRVSAICHHGKRRSQVMSCIQCYDEGTGGSIICEHRRQKYACPKCFDAGRETNSLCVHRTIKFKCKICSPAVHQPKSYKKRSGSNKSNNPNESSPYGLNGKKRGPTKKRDMNRAAAIGYGGLGMNMDDPMYRNIGDNFGFMGQQQPLFYHSHHPMMFSMPVQHMQPQQQQQQQGQSERGSNHASGYSYHTGPSAVPAVQPQGNFSSETFISTPIPTRRGSPELNKMAMHHQGVGIGPSGATNAGGLQILVPAMVPLPYPLHLSVAATAAGVGSNSFTPIISPPTHNSASIPCIGSSANYLSASLSSRLLSPHMSPIQAAASVTVGELATVKNEIQEPEFSLVSSSTGIAAVPPPKIDHDNGEGERTDCDDRNSETSSGIEAEEAAVAMLRISEPEEIEPRFERQRMDSNSRIPRPVSAVTGPRSDSEANTPYYFSTPYVYHAPAPMIIMFPTQQIEKK
ncbi:hypothetical protein HK100_009406 [Physocladia obscura]|uniref:Uncharacterized protein n=1 Tax=Physocladia obscura TaxID=109957 RepID=A0AAD5XHM9_9FUNG|nr:hypothetical protein HK100_009406 [Physocladia obscura]